MQAVELKDLSKTYPGGKRAVQSVSLSLAPGEVFGFLGPNGAGKTTTVKVLNGMIKPTEGQCRVFGYDPEAEPDKVHLLSGVVTENARMYDSMSGLENLIFYAEVFGIPREEGRKRAGALLEELELTEAADRKLASYSTGMRQRLSLARALIHRPKVLFLDEPTSGLDPESAQNVNRMIRSLARQEDIAVFLCTHQLRYAQEICTRYGLIDEGRLVAAGNLEELRSRAFAESRVRIRAGNWKDEENIRKCRDKEAAENPGKNSGIGTYSVPVSSAEEIPAIVRRMVQAGADIYEVEEEIPSLEEVYFALTTGEDGIRKTDGRREQNE